FNNAVGEKVIGVFTPRHVADAPSIVPADTPEPRGPFVVTEHGKHPKTAKEYQGTFINTETGLKGFQPGQMPGQNTLAGQVLTAVANSDERNYTLYDRNPHKLAYLDKD